MRPAGLRVLSVERSHNVCVLGMTIEAIDRRHDQLFLRQKCKLIADPVIGDRAARACTTKTIESGWRPGVWKQPLVPADLRDPTYAEQDSEQNHGRRGGLSPDRLDTD